MSLYTLEKNESKDKHTQKWIDNMRDQWYQQYAFTYNHKDIIDTTNNHSPMNKMNCHNDMIHTSIIADIEKACHISDSGSSNGSLSQSGISQAIASIIESESSEKEYEIGWNHGTSNHYEKNISANWEKKTNDTSNVSSPRGTSTSSTSTAKATRTNFAPINNGHTMESESSEKDNGIGCHGMSNGNEKHMSAKWEKETNDTSDNSSPRITSTTHPRSTMSTRSSTTTIDQYLTSLPQFVDMAIESATNRMAESGTIENDILSNYRKDSYQFGSFPDIDKMVLFFLTNENAFYLKRLSKYFDRLIGDSSYYFLLSNILSSLNVIPMKCEKLKWDCIRDICHFFDTNGSGSHLFMKRCLLNEKYEQFVHTNTNNYFYKNVKNILAKATKMHKSQGAQNENIGIEFINRFENECKIFLRFKAKASQIGNGNMFARCIYLKDENSKHS